MKTIDFNECAKNITIVKNSVKKGSKAIEKLWEKREDLHPCIANELLRIKRND